MDEAEKKIIQDAYRQLPTVLQEFIKQGTWEQEVEEMCASFGFNEDMTRSVEAEVVTTILGLTPISALATAFEQIPLARETAVTLSREIREKILSDVEETLHSVELENETGEGKDERLGGVEIEKHFSPQIPEVGLEKPFDKTKIIQDIESPKPTIVASKPLPSTSLEVRPPEKKILPSSSVPTPTQPLIAHNLTAQKLSGITKAPNPSTFSYPTGQDPYREPTK